MKRNLFGLMLVAAAYLISLGIAWRNATPRVDTPSPSSDTIVIRFAHSQLESGVRDAFEIVAQRYEDLHPGVKIEQNVVPESVYPSWLRTQLIGETVPDLVYYGGMIASDDLLARYFTALSTWLDEPNPYNQGTPLAGTPWRLTFRDNLEDAYNAALLDTYFVPVASFTIRMHYNLGLWQRLLGSTPPPTGWNEFLDVADRIEKASIATGHRVQPVAGSGYNANFLLDGVMRSLTQQLNLELHGGPTEHPDRVIVGLAFLADRIGLDHPAVLAGLHEQARLLRYLPPGFAQMRRDDALFQFSQENAMLLATGSWEAPSLVASSPFPVGVFQLPMPEATNPAFDGFVLGPANETAGATGGFALANNSAHQATAIDFLRFLTSYEGAQLFAAESRWLPPLRDVPVAPETVPYLPAANGMPNGFRLFVTGPNAKRAVQQQLHLLGRDGVEAFVAATREPYRTGVRQDLVRSATVTRQFAQRQDSLLVALDHLAATPGADADMVRRRDELMESYLQQSVTETWLSAALREEP
jgi:raffinose/stachyose/melibiose transport system substrate-binding protein